MIDLSRWGPLSTFPLFWNCIPDIIVQYYKRHFHLQCKSFCSLQTFVLCYRQKRGKSCIPFWIVVVEDTPPNGTYFSLSTLLYRGVDWWCTAYVTPECNDEPQAASFSVTFLYFYLFGQLLTLRTMKRQLNLKSAWRVWWRSKGVVWMVTERRERGGRRRTYCTLERETDAIYFVKFCLGAAFSLVTNYSS